MENVFLRKGTGIYAITANEYNNLSLIVQKDGLKKFPDFYTGTIPVEELNSGDYVLGIDRKFHRIAEKTEKTVTGLIAGIWHLQSKEPLFMAGNHRILCREKKISTTGDNFWKLFPQELYKRIKVHNKAQHEGSKILWDYVKNDQLGASFKKEFQIGPFITDFYSEKHKMIVEVDDDSHDSLNYQNIMDNFFKSKGITVLRFTTEDVVQNLALTLKHIRSIILKNIPSGFNSREWRRADTMEIGDYVYFSRELVPVRIQKTEFDETREPLYGISTENNNTLITASCLISCPPA